MRHTWTLLLGLLSACSGSSSETADTDPACDTAPPVTWDGWADGFFRTYCTSCHSAEVEDRWGAPEGVDFDNEADVARYADAVQTVVIDEPTMPPAGGVYDDDLALLEVYLRCGLP